MKNPLLPRLLPATALATLMLFFASNTFAGRMDAHMTPYGQIVEPFGRPIQHVETAAQ